MDNLKQIKIGRRNQGVPTEKKKRRRKNHLASLIGSPSSSTLLRRSWWHFGVYSWPTHHVSFPCLSHERFMHIKHVRKEKVGLKVRSPSCDIRQQWKLNQLFDVLYHLSYTRQCKNRGKWGLALYPKLLI